MSEQTDICICCGVDISDPASQEYVRFRYQIPGHPTENILTAVVCHTCADDSDNKLKFPAIEALINARVIRIENPNIKFTP